jgi:hypothetical protein
MTAAWTFRPASRQYYLMVNLPPGEHVITTGGTLSFDLPVYPPYLDGGPFSIDTLTTGIIDVVVPEPTSALLLLPALFGFRSAACAFVYGDQAQIWGGSVIAAQVPLLAN